jgi:hypothetical protein
MRTDAAFWSAADSSLAADPSAPVVIPVQASYAP